jgi:hypothetical protein
MDLNRQEENDTMLSARHSKTYALNNQRPIQLSCMLTKMAISLYSHVMLTIAQ